MTQPAKKLIPPKGVIIANVFMDVMEYKYNENENNIMPARKNISEEKNLLFPDKEIESITEA